MKKSIWNQAALPALAFCALVLAGCSTPAVPEHRFYRLLGSAPAAPAQTVRLPELAVRPLRADALYSERAIIFSDDQQRQLQQYHYHHWIYPPGELIQEHLAGYLRRAGVAPLVRLQDHGEAPFAVSGRVARFEKVMQNGQASAMVVLELRLDKKGKPLWQQTYSANTVQSDSSMNGFAAATEASLDRIYAAFVNDLSKVKLD